MNTEAQPLLHVDFQPVGRRIAIARGTDLLTAAQAAGAGLTSLCGGIGSCDACRVRILSGLVSPPTLEEESALGAQSLAEGLRLACQTQALGDARVEIPPESLASPQRLQVEGVALRPEVDPVVRVVDVQLKLPALQDLRADDLRLQETLAQEGTAASSFSRDAIRGLSNLLRTAGGSARLALRQEAVVAALPAGAPLLGLAVDLGTTKIAGYLVDLENGQTLASAGIMNPQISFGEDVISRIAYANRGEAFAGRMRQVVLTSLNELLKDLCDRYGVQAATVVEAVVVGNTAMHHLLLGLPVRPLGEAPYIAAATLPFDLSAAECGLEICGGGWAYFPPNIAGFVGGDHLAMLLACGLHAAEGVALALDIGTNTEISLCVGQEIYTCSAASGPVFEGAHIQDGMRAAPGAIERVQIKDGLIRLGTIGDCAPVGLCGSGILDAAAEMYAAGILTPSGRLRRDHPLVSEHDGRVGLLLAFAGGGGQSRPILVGRRDIHAIQLAKGAIRLGIEALLQTAQIDFSLVERVYIAGAFGSYIHIPSAVKLGMLPPLPLDRFIKVGNAAGVGARQMLVSARHRRLASELARRVQYVELTTYPNFMDEFTTWLLFPPLG